MPGSLLYQNHTNRYGESAHRSVGRSFPLGRRTRRWPERTSNRVAMKLVRLSLALALLAAPIASNAWWNDDWNFRKEISFDLTPTGADVAGSPTDLPVLIRLHIGNFTYF